MDDSAATLSPFEVAVGAASGSANQGGNTVEMNKAQTRTEAQSDDKVKGDFKQKETSDTKTSSSRYYTDIYGRVPGGEPKYPIPCPSECRMISNAWHVFQFDSLLIIYCTYVF